MSEVIQGVKSYVIDHAKVKKSENVLIAADTRTYSLIIDVVLSFCESQGAKTTITITESNRIPGGGDRIFGSALKAADKALLLTRNWNRDDFFEAMYDYGTVMCSAASSTREFFASEAARYPYELYYEVLDGLVPYLYLLPESVPYELSDVVRYDFQASLPLLGVPRPTV